MSSQRLMMPASNSSPSAGSAESAATFAERTEFPARLLLADESEETDAYAAVGTRNTRRDENGKQIFEGVESMWSVETNAGLKARGRDDLNAVVGGLFRPGIYTPLMSTGGSNRKAMDKTFVQGGTFIFDGASSMATAAVLGGPQLASSPAWPLEGLNTASRLLITPRTSHGATRWPPGARDTAPEPAQRRSFH